MGGGPSVDYNQQGLCSFERMVHIALAFFARNIRYCGPTYVIHLRMPSDPTRNPVVRLFDTPKSYMSAVSPLKPFLESKRKNEDKSNTIRLDNFGICPDNYIPPTRMNCTGKT